MGRQQLHNLDVSERQLLWMERHFFHLYDDAYARLHIDEHPVEDEVRAYKEAMETITEIRKELFPDDGSFEKQAEQVRDILDETPETPEEF